MKGNGAYAMTVLNDELLDKPNAAGRHSTISGNI